MANLYADRTSCHNWWLNQLRLMLSSLSYVLFDHIRRTALKNTRLEKATSATIRNKLIRIGAVIVHNTRRIRFHLSTSYSRKELVTLVAARAQVCCPRHRKNNGGRWAKPAQIQ